jgi:hypothetical protein
MYDVDKAKAKAAGYGDMTGYGDMIHIAPLPRLP